MDGNGDGVGALTFGGSGGISGGILDYYYNPTVFGTSDNTPAQISSATVNHWMLVNNATNLQLVGNAANLAGNYALGRSLDLAVDPGFSAPIGSLATPFSGRFDGMGRTISNLSLTSAASNLGLFGVVGKTGSVQNLGLINVSIAGTGASAVVGGLAGINQGTILRSYVDVGTVMSATNGDAGGLVGHNLGAVPVGTGPGLTASLDNSYVSGVTVTGGQVAGGLVARNQGGMGSVSTGFAGGAASITNSYVTGGSVSASTTVGYAGGLVGFNQSGTSSVGPGGAATIDNSYASGGLVSGWVKGALVGNNVAPSGNISAVYWNTDSSGVLSAFGGGNAPFSGAGLTDAQMRVTSNMPLFDFVTTWWQGDSTLPMLRSEWSNTITNAHQLQLMAMLPSANYMLANNIDLSVASLTPGAGSMWSAQGFSSIGNGVNPFSGGLAGNGNTISNLSIAKSAATNVGLFGVLTNGAHISNLTLANANVVGANRVGALAGIATGALVSDVTVSNAQVTATTSQAGGLVGRSELSALLGNSITGGTIQATASAPNAVGGMVGASYASFISNGQVTTPLVQGKSAVGGLVGLVGSTMGSGLIANNLVSTASIGITNTTTTVGGLIGSNAVGSIVYGNKVQGSTTVSSNWGLGGLIGSNNGLATRNSLSATNLYTLSIGGNGPLFGTDANVSLNALLQNHYEIDTVQLNLVPIVVTGGLYATQFTDWTANGSLNIANYSGLGQSLAISGGNYTISTTQGMKDLLGFAQDSRYSYALTASLDMSGLVNYSVPEFWGKFDGGGFTLTNLTINQPDLVNAGLFGWVGEPAVVKNLGLANAQVTGRDQVGSLAGVNSGEIVNVQTTSGAVTGVSIVGGLIGSNVGYVSASHVGTGVVTGVSVSGVGTVGGLVGDNLGSVNQSYVTAGVISAASTAWDIGGLVGVNQLTGVVQGSYVSNSSVTGGTNVGGLAGRNVSNSSGASGIIDSSYSDGVTVSGIDWVGGLVGSDGYVYGDGSGYGVINNYVTNGSVTSTGTVAGMISGNGLFPYVSTNNHYNIDTQTIKVGAMASPVNMVQRGGLYSAQFIDWVGSGDMATGGLALNIADYSGAGQSLALSGGNYNISNVQGMKDMLGFVEDSANTFVLNANVDISTLPNYSIPTLFASLDGQGNMISGLNIDLPAFNDVAFIQSNYGTVRNLGLSAPIVTGATNVAGLVALNNSSSWQSPGLGIVTGSFVSGGTITGMDGAIGGLVAMNDGTITQSYVVGTDVQSTATLLGASSWLTMGGLVGANGGSISSSFVSGGSVSAALTDGSAAVGGLVGNNLNWGSLSTSFTSGGTVSGTGAWNIGGVAGNNDGVIDSTYAAVTMNSSFGSHSGLVATNGLYATLSNSFWDKTLSGDASLYGIQTDFGYLQTSNVNGLLTTESQSSIITEAALGLSIGQMATTGGTTGLTWRIYEGQTTPMLLSFLRPLDVSVSGSRPYDGTTNVSGLVTYSVTPDANLLGTVVADTSSANVGTYSGITPSGLYSTPLGYDISYVSGSVDITSAGVTLLSVTAGNASKVYGTTHSFAGTEFTPVGLIGSDTISGVTLSSAGAVSTANAGAYAITASNAVFSVGSAANYTITYVDGTLTVTPKQLSISGSSAANKVYDGTTAASLTLGTLVGLVGSETLGVSAAGAFIDKHAGIAKPVSVVYTLSNGTGLASNYTLPGGALSADITPYDVTFTAPGISKTYDGTTAHTLTATEQFAFTSLLQSGDLVTTANMTFSDKNVGTGKTLNLNSVTINDGNGGANYNVTLAGNSISEITQADLVVTALPASKILSMPDPQLVYSASGLFDPVASVLSGTVERDPGELIGSYAIKQGSVTLLSSNYKLIFVPGTFLIQAPTVVQEITQAVMGNSTPEGSATDEKEKEEEEQVLAEADLANGQGNGLPDNLPVCR